MTRLFATQHTVPRGFIKQRILRLNSVHVNVGRLGAT